MTKVTGFLIHSRLLPFFPSPKARPVLPTVKMFNRIDNRENTRDAYASVFPRLDIPNPFGYATLLTNFSMFSIDSLGFRILWIYTINSCEIVVTVTYINRLKSLNMLSETRMEGRCEVDGLYPMFENTVLALHFS